jgi:hypothetical protein
MSPAKSIPIILDNLINAVEDHCSFSYYYLDRETGEILFQSERHHTNDANDAPDLDNRYSEEIKKSLKNGCNIIISCMNLFH